MAKSDEDPSQNTTADSGSKEPTEQRKLQVELIFGLVAVALAIWYLYSLYQPREGSREFTRVGGKTRIETAIEASRFWSNSGPVLLAPYRAPAKEMLDAGVQAAQLDAPILFSPSEAKLPKAVLVELRRLRDLSGQQGDFCIKLVDPSLRKAIPRDLAKSATTRACPRQTPVSTVPMNLVAPNGDFTPPMTSHEPPVLLSKVAGSSQGCNIGNKIYEKTIAKWWGDEGERRSRLRCDLPNTVVFATAQRYPDLPDVAVAVALTAHLARASASDQGAIVMLPRYLESNRDLEIFLHERGTKVARGIVVGGPDAISDELSKSLRSVMTFRNIGAIVQGSANVFEKVGIIIAVLAGLGLLGVGAGRAAGAAAHGTAQATHQLTKLRDNLIHMDIHMDMDTKSPRGRRPWLQPVVTFLRQKTDTTGDAEPMPKRETSKKEETSKKDTMELVDRIIEKDIKDAAASDEDTKDAKTDEVWVRLHLKSPEVWVAGKLDESIDSPFPAGDALWLTGVVQCDPRTGALRFGEEERLPLRRANGLAVRWEDIQVFEVISSDMMTSMRRRATELGKEGSA